MYSFSRTSKFVYQLTKRFQLLGRRGTSSPRPPTGASPWTPLETRPACPTGMYVALGPNNPCTVHLLVKHMPAHSGRWLSAMTSPSVSLFVCLPTVRPVRAPCEQSGKTGESRTIAQYHTVLLDRVALKHGRPLN